MSKSKNDRSRYYKYAAIALAVVFVFSAGLFLLSLWEKEQAKSEFPAFDPEEPILEYNGKDYELKPGIETFLVIGLDKYTGEFDADSYNNDKQADFLMLFVLDNNTESYSVIPVNRDTVTKVNILGLNGNPIDTVEKQIALAHTYGNGKEVSCRNTTDAVSDLFYGMRIDHYLSATMDAVPAVNDLVGGVEVTVLDDFTGIDNTLVKGETVTLTSEQALTYVRARQGMEDSSNTERMKRQRQYLEALKDKTNQKIAEDEEFIIRLTIETSEYTVTDRSLTQLQDLIRKISDYEFKGVTEIEGESKVGEFMEFHPDEASLKEIVVNLFYKEKE